MLKGLAITPPVLGRISIGKVIEKNGKRLPEKDDQFTITSQVQGKDGWLLHPLNDELRQGKDDKLRSIPVRLLFNESELNFRADYTLFDRQSGRPVCVGNGETCKRITQDGIPLYTPGYGRTSAKDGSVFEWVFNAPANYWDGASVAIKYLLDQNGGSRAITANANARGLAIGNAKADAVLAASIFHFGEYTVPEAKAYLASRGIVVR